MIDELCLLIRQNILKRLKNGELDELKKRASDSAGELKDMLAGAKPLRLYDAEVDE